MENIPPGKKIRLHHHPHAEEILFIHRGTGVATWKRIEIDSSLDRGYLAAHSPEALVGLGLALRAPNDKD